MRLHTVVGSLDGEGGEAILRRCEPQTDGADPPLWVRSYVDRTPLGTPISRLARPVTCGPDRQAALDE